MTDKQSLKIGEGKPGPGRKKGIPNRTTALLKDAILLAAERAGGADGMVGYLEVQAIANPGPFMALLGKVLPLVGPGENGEHLHTVSADAAFLRIASRLAGADPGTQSSPDSAE